MLEEQSMITDRLTADVRMPDLCLELHFRRAEGVVRRYHNIDLESAALVRRVWWTEECPFQMIYLIRTVGRRQEDLAEGIGGRLLDLLVDTP